MKQGYFKWLAIASALLLVCIALFSAAWLGLCMAVLEVKSPFERVTIVYAKKRITSDIKITPDYLEEREFPAWRSPFICDPYLHIKDVVDHYALLTLEPGDLVTKGVSLSTQPIYVDQYTQADQ